MILKLPIGNRLGSNCGVTAVAVLANVNFDVAFNTLKAMIYHRYDKFDSKYGVRGITRRPNAWVGKTSTDLCLDSLRDFGINMKEVTPPRKMTLKTWVLNYSRKNIVYMVTTTGHIQLVYNMYVLDQCSQNGGQFITEFSWRNRRIQMINKRIG